MSDKSVWLGVSVEDQATADLRIPALLDTPAAVRWISCEPLLGPVDLSDFVDRWHEGDGDACDWGRCDRAAVAVRRDFTHEDPRYVCMLPVCELHRGLDWVVVGGESGPGARPMHPEWVRTLRNQCASTGVAFHFKQWGEWAPVPPVEAMSSDRVVSRAGLSLPWPERHDLTLEAMREAYAMRRIGRHAAGRELDGRTWDEYPAERDHQ